MVQISKEVPAFQIAEIQLSYRTKVPASLRPVVCASRDAYEILMQSWDREKIEFVEQFKVLLMNRGHKVLGIFEVATGGMESCLADPKVIFAAAIKAGACTMILAHNHPSGNLQPSQSDIKLTKKIKDGGNLLDIKVYDHLIVTPESYFSFADDGIM